MSLRLNFQAASRYWSEHPLAAHGTSGICSAAFRATAGRRKAAKLRVTAHGAHQERISADSTGPPGWWRCAVWRVVPADLVQRPVALVGHHAGGRLSHRLAFLAAARSHSCVSRRAGVAALCRRVSAARVVVSVSLLPQEPHHASSRYQSDDTRASIPSPTMCCRRIGLAWGRFSGAC